MKKIVAASVIGFVILAIAFFSYPIVKLSIVSKNYGWYGSYVILPEDRNGGAADTKSVSLSTRSAEYREDGIQLTNVVYYPGLRQLAFGFVHDHAEREKYDRYSIEVVDSAGRARHVAGDGRREVLRKISSKTQLPAGRTPEPTGHIYHPNGGRTGSTRRIVERFLLSRIRIPALPCGRTGIVHFFND